MEENENIEEVQGADEVQNTESTEEQVVEQESPVSYKEDGTIVLDMNKVNELENAVQEQDTNEVSVRNESEASQELREENVEAANEEVAEQDIQEEVENVVQEVESAITESEVTGKPLPENIEKLIDFMNDTGGTVEDYVKLNVDYNEMDNLTTLQEYYKVTKPHLDAEERSFLMEENFSFDEEVDEDRDVKRKKIALKEQVAEAKAYLDGQKSKYYDEIKSNPSGQYKEAVDFFNRYNKEVEDNQKIAEERSNAFVERTDKVFNDRFEGFEYNVGEQKFKYDVKDAGKVKETQSDINNFINKFIDKDGKINDAQGYHKALYAAMNSDSLAQHFYEQGRADAIKNTVASSKNIDMSARTTAGDMPKAGMKARVLSNDNEPTFKIKRRK